MSVNVKRATHKSNHSMIPIKTEVTDPSRQVRNNVCEVRRLTWRKDPKETFSDFTLRVRIRGVDGFPRSSAAKRRKTTSPSLCSTATGVKNDDEIYEFPLHRCIVGYGTRKSQVLCDLFRQGIQSSSNEASSKLMELPELAFKALPQALDFMYFPEQPLFIDSTTALGLFTVSHALGMDQLMHDAKNFCQKDIRFESIATWYDQAKQLKSAECRTLVVDWCRTNVLQILATSDLVKTSDSELWLDILRSGPIQPMDQETFSTHLSNLVAEHYVHNDVVDGGLFESLTDPKYLTHLSLEAAKTLSDLEDEVLGNRRNRNKDAKLSSLQERCVATFSKNWQKVEEGQKNFTQFCMRKPQSFVTSILFASLKTAKTEVKEEPIA